MKNAITDVPGVRVGQLTVADGEIQTGVTVVLPYGPSVRHRKLFLGAFGGGRGGSFSGIEVTEDFGTFSSPIVLCNATTVGAAYDALITLGFRRDPELPTDDAWPPVVIGIDDGYLNDLRQRRVGHDDVIKAIEGASEAAAPCGSVGIGRGLVALGAKGGVGGGASLARIGGAEYVVGALIAANGGAAVDPTKGSVRSASPGFVAIAATDAPLFPEDLRALAEAALRGLDAGTPMSGADARLALAFSTANVIDGSTAAPASRLYEGHRVGEEGRAALCEAAARAAREGLRRALLEATAVTGKKGRTAAPHPRQP